MNNISIILVPTFGKLAIPLMTSTTVALCISTYILFVGSVARLMGTLGNEGGLPKIFSKVSKNNSPFVAILFLTIVNSISLILSILGSLNGANLALIGFPHIEIAIPALILLFITLYFNNYKKLRTEKDTINSVQLIESHNIYRNNKLINYKQLSNILLKHKILSQMKWRQKIVQKMYIFLDNNNISREEIVKKIAQRLDLKIEHKASLDLYF